MSSQRGGSSPQEGSLQGVQRIGRCASAPPPLCLAIGRAGCSLCALCAWIQGAAASTALGQNPGCSLYCLLLGVFGGQLSPGRKAACRACSALAGAPPHLMPLFSRMFTAACNRRVQSEEPAAACAHCVRGYRALLPPQLWDGPQAAALPACFWVGLASLGGSALPMKAACRACSALAGVPPHLKPAHRRSQQMHEEEPAGSTMSSSRRG